MPIETLDEPWSQGHRPQTGKGPPVPGLLLVLSGGRAALKPIPLEDGGLVIGRGKVGRAVIDDACLSRRHAEVTLQEGIWRITDLGSRNGTAVDAKRLTGTLECRHARVLRCGESLFLLSADVAQYDRTTVETRDGVVVGPALRRAWSEIDYIARNGDVLHLTGETGSGKERAAERFHASSARSKGPLVPVNCATIPHAIAERLLYGAKKGAFSGADADVDGYVQAADGGTLFLDEIAELDASVQAKLLRVIESREVIPVGATRGRRVDFRLCTATHGDLEERVAAGKFRQDLYFRLGRPLVRVPPLRERAEEVPWLVQVALEGGKPPHVSLMEVAMARPWPGNVRELFREVREAARAAAMDSSEAVEGRHLAPGAGLGGAAHADREQRSPVAAPRRNEAPNRDAIVDALRANAGNVARAARALGVHRTQLRRWLDREGVDPKSIAGEGSDSSR